MPSSLFKKAREYVKEAEYDAWFILSAKYGLLLPTDTIFPYNQTLNNMKVNEVKEWSNDVFSKLIEYQPTYIDFYAGEKYRSHLIPLLEKQGVICNVPLQGLGIGQQMKFYNENRGK
jgi:cytoplasmic iron level regulating protein YaaA (DUF328/UPF0246 family)